MRDEFQSLGTFPGKLLTAFSIILFAACFALINRPILAQDEEKPTILNKVPAEVPIKVEILTPEKANDFPEKVQIKVTNTAQKPIYALRMILDMVDVREKSELAAPNGKPFYYGYDLVYGRRELQGIPEESPKENDVPIRPGESHIFKIDKNRVKSIRNRTLSRGDQMPQTYQIIFFSLNYGDETGFSGASPYSLKKN